MVEDPDYLTFLDVCQQGDVNQAKTMWREKPINLLSQDYQIFWIVGQSRNLPMIAWLWSLSHGLDLTVVNLELFRWAATTNQVELAHWLWSIQPRINLHIENEYIISTVLEQDHQAMRQWLLTIEPTNRRLLGLN